jgi:hypothetical protein
MVKRIALSAILLMAAASSGAAALHFWPEPAEFQDESSYPEMSVGCPTQFHDFRQAVVWHSGGKRLLIEAREACGDRLGHTYDLEGVKLSIVSSNGTLISQFESPSGAFSLIGNKLVIGDAVENKSLHCMGDASLMVIDLSTGEARMPGHRFYLNSNIPLPCGI